MAKYDVDEIIRDYAWIHIPADHCSWLCGIVGYTGCRLLFSLGLARSQHVSRLVLDVISSSLLNLDSTNLSITAG